MHWWAVYHDHNHYNYYYHYENLPDECVSTKLRVVVHHVCFHLVTQFYHYNYYYYN